MPLALPRPGDTLSSPAPTESMKPISSFHFVSLKAGLMAKPALLKTPRPSTELQVAEQLIGARSFVEMVHALPALLASANKASLCILEKLFRQKIGSMILICPHSGTGAVTKRDRERPVRRAGQTPHATTESVGPEQRLQRVGPSFFLQH